MIRTRPIVTWPGKMTPHHERERPRYSATPNKTRKELLRELELIGARDCFIQAAYRDDQIRLDGLPYAGASPAHPGVILTYTLKNGATYQLPCDTFDSAEQNLRAIVLTLQRLRLIEETGVRTHGRQYEGFKQLPPGTSSNGAQPAMTVEEACLFIAKHHQEALPTAAEILASAEAYRFGYRLAAKRLHPDAGGEGDGFVRLQEAARVLDKHHNL